MVHIVGKYQHSKSENLDKYFTAIGIPYLARKVITSSSPYMEIALSERGEWCIQVNILIKTIVIKFKIGEEFEESMPFGTTLKSIASFDGAKLTINSTIVSSGVKMSRSYMCAEDGCVVVMDYEGTVTAKRYFRRIY